VNTTRSTVLIVDDVTKNLQVVGTILRTAGYAVIAATSGSEALEGLRVQLPDLILLDLMMPVMDGLEVCRRLKAEAATAQIPVIFLTASNEMEHLVAGFQAGAVDYVTKPFNAPELLARVRTHLELKHARQRLREMNDEKNEFMGIAAHDLRSPLTALKGYLELIAEDPEMERQEIHTLADRMIAATKRMVEMVEQLLNANAIERGEVKVRLQPCDLAEILTSVVDSFRPRAGAKQQTICLELSAAGGRGMADLNLIVQVLENLLSNAVKYSPPGKNIDVRLKAAGEGISCEVQDEGPGLSAEDQKRLFSKFGRLSAKPTAGEPSVGLGLSIVKRMVEEMNGRVWCESELGKGAKFVVSLPVAPD
jgi:two-component system sensor histidine kinase/response regulator